MGSGSFLLRFFFGLYCEANGFTETEVILTEIRDRSVWYRVREPPMGGKRITVGSRSAMYALVRTKKMAEVLTASSPLTVQQSDYVHAWGCPATVRNSHCPSLPARRRKRVPFVSVLKRTLGVYPPLFRMVRRTNNILNNVRYQVRSARYLENCPDLFEELTIADAIRS